MQATTKCNDNPSTDGGSTKSPAKVIELFGNLQAEPATIDGGMTDGGTLLKREELAGLLNSHHITIGEARIVLGVLNRMRKNVSSGILQGGDALNHLLRNNWIVQVGSKTAVAYWKDEPNSLHKEARKYKVLNLTPFAQFQTFHADKRVILQNGLTDVKEAAATSIFLKQANRYSGVVYAPGMPSIVHGHMNMWQGFAIQPKQGDWSLIRRHIYEVYASEDRKQCEYALNWFAFAFQNPGEQAEVILGVRGLEGTGKGIIFRMMVNIFGPHGLHVSNPRHLAGNFNKHLQHCSFLFADEAFWGGNKEAEGTLKRISTEETLFIEPKGVDPYSVKNCLHIAMATNEDWMVPASADARRYALLDFSNKRKGDRAYFNRLGDQIENGGAAAMLYELLRRDIKGWHPRDAIPQTKALAKQKELSLRGVDKLVFELANEGMLPCRVGPRTPRTVDTSGEEHSMGFISFAKRKITTLTHASASEIKEKLRDEWGCKPYHGNGKRGLTFPPLEEMRTRFENKYGPKDWLVTGITDWTMQGDPELGPEPD